MGLGVEELKRWYKLVSMPEDIYSKILFSWEWKLYSLAEVDRRKHDMCISINHWRILRGERVHLLYF